MDQDCQHLHGRYLALQGTCHEAVYARQVAEAKMNSMDEHLRDLKVRGRQAGSTCLGCGYLYWCGGVSSASAGILSPTLPGTLLVATPCLLPLLLAL